MIRVLVLDHYRDTIDRFLQTWGRSLQSTVRSIAYESAPHLETIAGSAFIFTDLERLTEAQRNRAQDLCDAIESSGGRVLNRPSKTLCRYDLLRMLHATGANPFNVYREAELSDAMRFPVFVRRERAHNGALTPLLNNMDELKAALHKLKNNRAAPDDLLAVEYIHTASPADGLFRKYSLLRIGGRLIPRHILFSSHWVDKDQDWVRPETVREENLFLDACPHFQEVGKIFERAGVDYGRIDYSVLDDRLVTWEINTNPNLMPSPEKCHPQRLPGQAVSAKLIHSALTELSSEKSITASLADCPPIIESSELPLSTRCVMFAARCLSKLDEGARGRRLLRGISKSIRLAKERSSK